MAVNHDNGMCERKTTLPTSEVLLEMFYFISRLIHVMQLVAHYCNMPSLLYRLSIHDYDLHVEAYRRRWCSGCRTNEKQGVSPKSGDGRATTAPHTHAHSLPLPLLLRRYDLERRSRFLFRHATGRTLLRHLAPASTALVVRCRTRRRAVSSGIENALVSQLAAADEFFCEAATIESLGVGVHRIGDNLGFGGQ